jgi:hypothetical protein
MQARPFAAPNPSAGLMMPALGRIVTGALEISFIEPRPPVPSTDGRVIVAMPIHEDCFAAFTGAASVTGAG